MQKERGSTDRRPERAALLLCLLLVGCASPPSAKQRAALAAAERLRPEIARLLGVPERDYELAVVPSDELWAKYRDTSIEVGGPFDEWHVGHELAHVHMLDTPWRNLPDGAEEGVASVVSMMAMYPTLDWTEEPTDPSPLLWHNTRFLLGGPDKEHGYNQTAAWVYRLGLDRLREIAYRSSNETEAMAALWEAVEELESP